MQIKLKSNQNKREVNKTFNFILKKNVALLISKHNFICSHTQLDKKYEIKENEF